MAWEARREQELDQYERYLRRELPRLVRQRLEVAVSDISGSLETELRNRLVDIVRDSQSQLFQLYRAADPKTDESDARHDVSGEEASMIFWETLHMDQVISQESDVTRAPTSFDFTPYYPQLSVGEGQTNPMDTCFLEPFPTWSDGEHPIAALSGDDSTRNGVQGLLANDGQFGPEQGLSDLDFEGFETESRA